MMIWTSVLQIKRSDQLLSDSFVLTYEYKDFI